MYVLCNVISKEDAPGLSITFRVGAVMLAPIGCSNFISKARYITQSLTGHNFATICPIDLLQLPAISPTSPTVPTIIDNTDDALEGLEDS